MVSGYGPSNQRALSAIRGVVWSGLSLIVPAIASLMVFFFVARFLNPSLYGVFAVAAGVVGFCAILLPMGFIEALVQNQEIGSNTLNSVFWVSIILAAPAYALLYIISIFFSALKEYEQASVVISILGLRLIFDAAGIVPQAIILRRMAFKLITYRTILGTIVSAGISIILISNNYGVIGLAVAQVSSSIVMALAVMWGAKWVPRFSVDLNELKKIGGYAAFSSGTRAVGNIVTQTDAAIVGIYLPLAQVGIYSFSNRMMQIVMSVLSGSLSTVAHPLFSSIQNNEKTVKSGFLISVFISSAIAFPIYVVIGYMADLIIPALFGAKWLEAVWPVRLLCAVGLIASIGSLQGALINSLGYAKWWFCYQLAAGVGTVVILFAISPYGVEILLLAIVIKTFFLWPIALLKTVRLISTPIREYLEVFIAPVLACILMLICLTTSRLILFANATNVWEVVAAETVIGIISYSCAMIILARSRLKYIIEVIYKNVAKSKRHLK